MVSLKEIGKRLLAYFACGYMKGAKWNDFSYDKGIDVEELMEEVKVLSWKWSCLG